MGFLQVLQAWLETRKYSSVPIQQAGFTAEDTVVIYVVSNHHGQEDDDAHQGNKTLAAEALGLTRQGLLKKIQRYGINAG